MKFRNISKDVHINAYGYNFKQGVAVDVIEDNLITKFRKYNTLEEVSDGMQEQRQEVPGESADAAAEAGPVDRDELKAQADALGIKYHAKIKTEHLIDRIKAHGGN